MPEDVMFQEAIQAARQGKRIRARDLLTRLLRSDQTNPKYWIWLSAVVDTRKEQIYCLQSALKLDPNDGEARKGLI
jgi:Flp pilus assembly protein TadD